MLLRKPKSAKDQKRKLDSFVALLSSSVQQLVTYKQIHPKKKGFMKPRASDSQAKGQRGRRFKSYAGQFVRCP